MRILKQKKVIFLLTIVFILIIRHIICFNTSFFIPDYDFQSIENEISLSKNDTDYERISKYTGLSPFASMEMIESGENEKILRLNKMYFEMSGYKREYIAFPITAQERNDKIRPPMAKLRNGDILITYNTHTLDWRHGHAAIVVNEDEGIILEHMSIGQTSVLSYASKWAGYPGFIILRHPDEEIAEKASEYAFETLVDIPYSIFAGIVDKDMSDDDIIESSHCSHIVWQAYMAAGCDIDSDKGFVVTPKDIAMSDELKIVQIFGINPKEYKDRFLY